MSRIISALREHAAMTPNYPAVQTEDATVSYRQLLTSVEEAARALEALSPRVLALHADNGIAWAIADLAALACGIPVVPLPSFFSAAQTSHVLRSAGVDCILTDRADRFATVESSAPAALSLFSAELTAIRIRPPTLGVAALPEGTQKITFTSGTTGDPKGVCLGIEELETAADSLRIATSATPGDRHLCVLPLATLLENVGGLYTPILAGATTCIPRLANVGLIGSSSLDISRLASAIEAWRASSAILIPQMLISLVAAYHAGTRMSYTMRYLAVGGAPISASVLEAAANIGLPVYQGYGLSECASVVATNRPGSNRRGSVGRPLPHVSLDFAADGEILVRGVRWRGYLGHAPDATDNETVVATGDLGYLDADGFLHLTGRKKNIFITSFGRNVAPEWVERELVSQPPILQAAVFGEARPFNTAVIFAPAAATPEAIEAALDAANDLLPDYARLRAWVRADEPFTVANGLATANGRLRRDRIHAAYAQRIDERYSLPNPVEIE